MKKILLTLLFSLLIAPVLSQAQEAASTTTATTEAGYELKDPTRGFTFTTPNAEWGINVSKHSVSMSHGTYYDAYVSLRKSWYTVSNSQEAYTKKKESLTSYLPGAEMVTENETLKIGSADAVSMTYKDPAQKKVHREIVFIYNGVPYEITFTVKEENFDKVKDDFSKILQGIKTN